MCICLSGFMRVCFSKEYLVKIMFDAMIKKKLGYKEDDHAFSADEGIYQMHLSNFSSLHYIATYMLMLMMMLRLYLYLNQILSIFSTISICACIYLYLDLSVFGFATFFVFHFDFFSHYIHI